MVKAKALWLGRLRCSALKGGVIKPFIRIRVDWFRCSALKGGVNSFFIRAKALLVSLSLLRLKRRS